MAWKLGEACKTGAWSVSGEGSCARADLLLAARAPRHSEHEHMVKEQLSVRQTVRAAETALWEHSLQELHRDRRGPCSS